MIGNIAAGKKLSSNSTYYVVTELHLEKSFHVNLVRVEDKYFYKENVVAAN